MAPAGSRSAKTKKKRKPLLSRKKKASTRRSSGTAGRRKAVTRKTSSARTATRKTSTRKRGAGPSRGRKAHPARRDAGSPGFGISPVYLEARREYEKGMALLQKRHFDAAAEQFQRMIRNFPEVNDLVDRARVYITLCRKQNETAPPPEGFDDHYYQGVFLSNEREYDRALEHFEKALALRPDSEKVHYSMATVLCLKGDRDRALAFLRKAVKQDPVNRIHARNDPELQSLHGDPEFDELVGLGERTPAG